ncbi:tyrosine-type recombinase/integrase [Chloroflexota bacterium]
MDYILLLDLNNGLGFTPQVKYIHTTLHKVLNSAVKMGMISRNPADSVDIPKVNRREMQVMTEADIHILLEYTRETPYYALFYLAIFTGMRRSELLALRWIDIDLILSQISVSRTLHQLHNRDIVIRQTKTDKGRRLIALSPSTTSVLREYRTQQETTRGTLGLNLTDADLVFSQYDGKPLLPDSITQAWRHIAKISGLDGIRPHDARHTHASLMLKQGIHPKIVQERLGHASIQITLDTYSHIAPGLQQAAANCFDDILLPNKSKESVR